MQCSLCIVVVIVRQWLPDCSSLGFLPACSGGQHEQQQEHPGQGDTGHEAAGKHAEMASLKINRRVSFVISEHVNTIYSKTAI